MLNARTCYQSARCCGRRHDMQRVFPLLDEAVRRMPLGMFVAIE